MTSYKGNWRHVLFFNDTEEAMLQNLIEFKGFRTKAEVMRTALRDMHSQMLPGYVLKTLQKPKSEPQGPELMTNEQYCEITLGGRCRNGQCVFKAGSGQDVEFELSTIKSIDPDHPVIDMHRSLLDGTFVYADGSVPSPEQVTDILRDWREIPIIAGGKAV